MAFYLYNLFSTIDQNTKWLIESIFRFSPVFADCTIPSPAPSPSPITVCDIDIFAGDLPNLDDLTLVSEFAQMESAHNPRSQRGAFGMGSSGEGKLSKNVS